MNGIFVSLGRVPGDLKPMLRGKWLMSRNRRLNTAPWQWAFIYENKDGKRVEVGGEAFAFEQGKEELLQSVRIAIDGGLKIAWIGLHNVFERESKWLGQVSDRAPRKINTGL